MTSMDTVRRTIRTTKLCCNLCQSVETSSWYGTANGHIICDRGRCVASSELHSDGLNRIMSAKSARNFLVAGTAPAPAALAEAARPVAVMLSRPVAGTAPALPAALAEAARPVAAMLSRPPRPSRTRVKCDYCLTVVTTYWHGRNDGSLCCDDCVVETMLHSESRFQNMRSHEAQEFKNVYRPSSSIAVTTVAAAPSVAVEIETAAPAAASTIASNARSSLPRKCTSFVYRCGVCSTSHIPGSYLAMQTGRLCCGSCLCQYTDQEYLLTSTGPFFSTPTAIEWFRSDAAQKLRDQQQQPPPPPPPQQRKRSSSALLTHHECNHVSSAMLFVEKPDGFTCDKCHTHDGERGASAYTCTACYHTLHARHGSSTISADDRFDWCVPCYAEVHGKRRRSGNDLQRMRPKRLRAAAKPAESLGEAIGGEIDNGEDGDIEISEGGETSETSEDETSDSEGAETSEDASSSSSLYLRRLSDNGASGRKTPDELSFDALRDYRKEPGARKCIADFQADRRARGKQKRGVVLLDAFAGAGTALLAAVRLKIRVDAYIAIESNPHCRKHIAEVCQKLNIPFALHDDVTRGGYRREVEFGITDETVEENRFGIKTLSALMEKVGCSGRMIDLYTFGSYVLLYRARALSLSLFLSLSLSLSGSIYLSRVLSHCLLLSHSSYSRAPFFSARAKGYAWGTLAALTCTIPVATSFSLVSVCGLSQQSGTRS